jgi:two-component sensor histidine kinase
MADSLQDQGASLREAQRIAGIGSWEHVLGGDAVRWSEGLNLVLGRDAATGPPAFAALSRYYTPASWERLRTATAATIQTGAPFELELEMVREDGTKCWTTTRGEALRGPDGAVAGVRGTVHDITERKRVEEQLRHQTALLEAQANASIDGILVVDSEGRKIFQNRRTVELWKIPKEVAEDSDDAAQVRHVMNLTRNPGQFAERVAYLYSHPDETTRDEVELLDGTVLDRYSAPVLGKEGEVYGRIWMFRDITEARLGEERIRAALAEKEVLLKEIYHRVKNNLQVVSSLLSLQSRRVADVATKRLLDDSANRVNSMALVHEQLYRAGNLSSIGLAEYLRQLTDSLVSVNQPLSTRVVLRLEVDEVTLGVESAIPLGLVANELVSNAYRHGYDAMAARGEIVVRLTGLPDGRVCLVVQDDGRGLPADFEPGRGGSLGMQLVMTLAQQLGAELTWNSGDGCTCFTLRFAPPAALAAQEAVA